MQKKPRIPINLCSWSYTYFCIDVAGNILRANKPDIFFIATEVCVSVARTQEKNINKVILYVETATGLYQVTADIDIDSHNDVTATPATNSLVAVGKTNVL